MLERVRERLAAASMLVTFNGKSFDMPLLRTRFAMAGWKSRPRRRISTFCTSPGACTAAPRHGLPPRRDRAGRLGFERVDDVASGDVSACYLHFLRTGDARALLGVIEHNAWDVVAMAALLGLYGEPLGGSAARRGRPRRRRAHVAQRGGARAATAVAEGGGRARRGARLDPRAGRDREGARRPGERSGDFEALAATVDDASARLELAKL